MPHMKPEYTNEPFMSYEDDHGETHILPRDMSLLPENGWTENIEILPEWAEDHDYEEHDGQWFARLSAPGYLDCTDWLGPYDSLEEAKEELSRMYDVDPDTGEPLTD